MTQIKLRRDTAANFTSKNPVLGVGEPAYETDTKKLKIGDGTTAYTQLEYFSAGGGGSTPTNMVTTDTAQTITGDKTFDKVILPTDSSGKGIYIAGNTSPSISAQNGNLSIRNVAGFGCESLTVGSSSNKNGLITVGNYPETGISEIKFAGYDLNNTSTVAYNGMQYDASTKKYYLGDTALPLYILGSPILDINNKKFLTQKNVTAGDDISITETTDGIKISSTLTGAITIDDILPDYTARIELGGYTSASNQFTAPCAGYIVPLISLAFNTDKYAPYINGVRHGYGAIDRTPSTAFSDTFFIVNKGDKFYATGITSYLDAGGFYPMKGANK